MGEKGEDTNPIGSPSDRFIIKEQLGRGGMGVVYRAHDRVRGVDVALKTLRQVDGQTLYRFKKEFRFLADIAHPNLVALHELLSVGDDWFFTMDLVEGVEFLEYVRPHRHLAPVRPESSRPSLTPSRLGPATLTPHREATGREREVNAWRQQLMAATLHLGRLRSALRQLVAAVQALHHANRLHRDIKPSNVLVSAAGRVSLCDFGLVVQAAEEQRTRELLPVGTPIYMAPEQISNEQVSEAADWYAVGVMLYEALYGQVPFSGRSDEIAHQKLRLDPAPPSDRASEVPHDLEDLCLRLLSRSPEARASGDDILAVVGSPPDSTSLLMPPAAVRTPFVGRDRQLGLLRSALRSSRMGRSVAILVHGRSGMGKSALLRRFLDEVANDGDAIILEGRCYERESVPYKALDTLVDALSSYLLQQPWEEVDAIMPPDSFQLGRLFPVLKRVKAVADPRVRDFNPPDPQESRRRGFTALRSLLERLAERHPLVLSIDDVQWGDVDSAPFLTDLIHHPDAPRVLLILSYRREETETSPLLRTLLKPGDTGVAGDVRHIPVDELSDADAMSLVRDIVGSEKPDVEQRAARVVHESRGNPFFLAELARADAESGATTTLERVLRDRVAGLPRDARALLTAIAVAGRPIPLSVANRAAEAREETASLAQLRALRLVRTRAASGRHDVEPFHDRIRETVVAGLPPAELAQCHLQLVRALEESKRQDYQAMVAHSIGAGDLERAGRYAVRAAARSEKAYAFDRAVYYYSLVLEHKALGVEERRAVRRRMGDALANAGRLLEAGQAYMSAADGAEESEALDLRRLAVEQLLRCGQAQLGMEQARALLSEVGVSLPQSPRSTMFSIALRRAWLAVRGLRFKVRAENEVPLDSLRRLGVCWSMGTGLSLVDPMLGTAFQMKYLVYALRAGEPHNVALGLALEMGFSALSGHKGWTRAQRLAERALAVAERFDDGHALGLCYVTSGIAAYLSGHWEEAARRLTTGEKILRDHCVGVTWERNSACFFHMAALLYQGRIRELTRLVPIYLQEALNHGDEFAASGLRSWRSNVAWLATDSPEEARRQAHAATIHLPENVFHLHHYYELLTHRQIDLYVGDGPGAWQALDERWPALEHSLLLRVQMIRIEMQFLRARCALAAGEAGVAEASMLRIAERSARQIEKEKSAWGAPHAHLIRGIVALRRHNQEVAMSRIRSAADGFDAAGMRLLAAVSRRRLGTLLGGDVGKALQMTALDWFRSERIRAPDSMTSMYAPGFE